MTLWLWASSSRSWWSLPRSSGRWSSCGKCWAEELGIAYRSATPERYAIPSSSAQHFPHELHRPEDRGNDHHDRDDDAHSHNVIQHALRSEERRVGKECSRRCTPT